MLPELFLYGVNCLFLGVYRHISADAIYSTKEIDSIMNRFFSFIRNIGKFFQSSIQSVCQIVLMQRSDSFQAVLAELFNYRCCVSFGSIVNHFSIVRSDHQQNSHLFQLKHINFLTEYLLEITGSTVIILFRIQEGNPPWGSDCSTADVFRMQIQIPISKLCAA